MNSAENIGTIRETQPCHTRAGGYPVKRLLQGCPIACCGLSQIRKGRTSCVSISGLPARCVPLTTRSGIASSAGRETRPLPPNKVEVPRPFRGGERFLKPIPRLKMRGTNLWRPSIRKGGSRTARTTNTNHSLRHESAAPDTLRNFTTIPMVIPKPNHY